MFNTYYPFTPRNIIKSLYLVTIRQFMHHLLIAMESPSAIKESC